MKELDSEDRKTNQFLPDWLQDSFFYRHSYFLGSPRYNSNIHYVVELPSAGQLHPSFSKRFTRFYGRSSLWNVKDSGYFVLRADQIPNSFEEFLRFFSEELYSLHKKTSNKNLLYVDPVYVKLLLAFHRFKKLSLQHRRMFLRYRWSKLFADKDDSVNVRPLFAPLTYEEKSAFYVFDNDKFWHDIVSSDYRLFKSEFPFSVFVRHILKFSYIYLLFFCYFLFLSFLFCLFFLFLFALRDYICIFF